jgi:hypothetical protein
VFAIHQIRVHRLEFLSRNAACTIKLSDNVNRINFQSNLIFLLLPFPTITFAHLISPSHSLTHSAANPTMHSCGNRTPTATGRRFDDLSGIALRACENLFLVLALSEKASRQHVVVDLHVLTLICVCLYLKCLGSYRNCKFRNTLERLDVAPVAVCGSFFCMIRNSTLATILHIMLRISSMKGVFFFITKCFN